MPGLRPTLVALLVVAAPAVAADPTPDPKALSSLLRPMLLAALPNPLAVTPMGWGDQREVTIGVKWEKQRLLYKPVPMKAVRNDGHWQKVTLTALAAADSLTLTIRDVRIAGEKTYFRADIGMTVRAVYEHQLWTLAKRVYAGETHVRCRAVLALTCELTSDAVLTPGALLPTLKIRARATEAKVGYSDLVCEHTLGVSGKPAEVLGKTAVEVMRKVAPQVERDLLAKANAAVLKVADTKDVRVELDKFLSKSGK